MSEIITIEQVKDLVKPHSTIMFGGFQLNRAPVALASELAKSGKQYSLVSLPNPVPLIILLKNGAISSMHVSFNGVALKSGFTIPTAYRQAIEGRQVEWRESDVYEIIQGLRAARMGLPFLTAPDLDNSDYAKVNDYKKVKDPFSGEELIAIPPLAPEVAFIHVQKADKQGNLWIADPLYDELLITASKTVIVSCEELVDRIAEPTISSLYVEYIVPAANGARPTSCYGYYEPDEEQVYEILG